MFANILKILATPIHPKTNSRILFVIWDVSSGMRRNKRNFRISSSKNDKGKKERIMLDNLWQQSQWLHRTLFCICGLATCTGQNKVVNSCSWLFLTDFENRYEMYMSDVCMQLIETVFYAARIKLRISFTLIQVLHYILGRIKEIILSF